MKTKKIGVVKRNVVLSMLLIISVVFASTLVSFERKKADAATTASSIGNYNIAAEGDMEEIVEMNHKWGGSSKMYGISEDIFWQDSATPYMTLSDDAYEGDHSLQFLFNKDAVNAADAKSLTLVIPRSRLDGTDTWFFVSFMAKRINGGARLLVKPGYISWGWQERTKVDCFNSDFDEWTQVNLLLPTDAQNGLVANIMLELYDWGANYSSNDTLIPGLNENGGVLIDNLMVIPYSKVLGTRENKLSGSAFASNWNGVALVSNEWTGTAYTGFTDWFDMETMNGKGNAYIGTQDDKTPQSLIQAVTLEPNTGYELSFYTKKLGAGFHENDRLKFGLKKGDEIISECAVSIRDFKANGSSQYAQVTAALMTSAETDYTFYFEFEQAEAGEHSWRGFFLAEAYLYENDIASISLSENTASLSVNGKYQLSVIAAFEDYSSSAAVTTGFTAVSSDTNIATVSNGVVTGHKDGTATITVTYGGKTDTVDITVTKQLASISVAAAKTSVEVGGTTTITVTATYDDSSTAAATNYTAESSNTAVVTVSGNTITAVAAGTATITVTFEGKTNTVTITVTAKEETKKGCNGSVSGMLTMLMLGAAILVSKKAIR